MTEFAIAAISAVWLGILTSVSPCPLATNITAISFVGRRAGSTRKVLFAGLLYTLGRALVYTVLGVLLVSSLLSAPMLSATLQSWMNRLLGPLLVLVGMVMLGLLRLPNFGRGAGKGLQDRAERWGILGALALGCLFALSFCPVSAALFFGSLLPLAIRQNSGFVLPFLYGIGTALPVVGFALVLAFGAERLGRIFRQVSRLEQWMRMATGVVFICVGIYFSLVYVYGVT